MSIVNTTVTQDAHTQRDGRRDVTERHVFSSGEVVTVTYRAEVGADTAAMAAARVPVLEQAMADAEAQGVMNG